MRDTRVSVTDLRALLDVAEGFTTENGLDAVTRYAVPEEVQQAINHATAAVCEIDGNLQPKGMVVLQS